MNDEIYPKNIQIKMIKNVNDVIFIHFHEMEHKICICRQAKVLVKYYVSLKLEKSQLYFQEKMSAMNDFKIIYSDSQYSSL